MNQKYQFVASQASVYPITLLCRVQGITRSGYYAFRNRASSRRELIDQHLSTQIGTIFQASRTTYGSPRVHAELRAQGVRCSRTRVARLMRQASLVARQRRRRVGTTDSQHDRPVAADLLERRFTATAPNTIWVADITYLATHEGWLYLAVILDLFARRMVGWSMQPTRERSLVVMALTNAVQ